MRPAPHRRPAATTGGTSPAPPWRRSDRPLRARRRACACRSASAWSRSPRRRRRSPASRIRLADGRTAEGMAAELLAPKWFDKNPALSNEDNFDQLRAALGIARGLYLDGASDTAFGHFARHYRAQIERGARARPEPPGRELRPGADRPRRARRALPRARPCRSTTSMRRNLAGIGADRPLPRPGRLRLRRLPRRPAARADDRRAPHRRPGRPDHRAPTRPSASATACPRRSRRWSPPTATAGSSSRSAATSTPTSSGWRASPACSTASKAATAPRSTATSSTTTSTACSRCGSGCAPSRALARLCAQRRLHRAADQAAGARWRSDVSALSAQKPVIIDESDDSLDAFVRARDLGYRGVSSKTCKGLYKSLINRARCAQWNRDESRASRAALHERRGPDDPGRPGAAAGPGAGVADGHPPRRAQRPPLRQRHGRRCRAAEQQAFLAAHPDLYERSHGAVRVRIRDGALAIGSLGGIGFASGAAPDWAVDAADAAPAMSDAPSRR